MRRHFSKVISAVTFDGAVAACVFLAGGLVLGDAYLEGRIPLKTTSRASLSLYSTMEDLLSADDINSLEKTGYLVVDNVLSPQDLRHINLDLIALNAARRFENTPNDDDTVRTDRVCFMLQSDRNDVLNRRLSRPVAERISPGDSGVLTEEDEITATAAGTAIISSTASTTAPTSSRAIKAGSGEGLLHVQRMLRGIGSALESKEFKGFQESTTTGSSSHDDADRTGGDDWPLLRAPKLFYRGCLDMLAAALVVPSAAATSAASASAASAVPMIRFPLSVPDQVQVSLYSASGTYYSRHTDGVSPNMFYKLGLLEWMRCSCYRARAVTAILYLNDGAPWDSTKDGGCLRLYLDSPSATCQQEGTTSSSSTSSSISSSTNSTISNTISDDDSESRRTRGSRRDVTIVGAGDDDQRLESSFTIVDIEPIGGRMVIFDSQRILHEVRPTHRARYAAAVWFTRAGA